MAGNKIIGRTRIFGILGFPLKHTLSPRFQNAAFAALKINAVYVPFEVPPSGLKEKVKELMATGVSGLNVTIPYKEAIVPLLDSVSSMARKIGAVNTVLFKDGRSKGYNTDAEGFMLSLKKDLGVSAEGKSVFLYGAGGAAKAIAYALADGGAKSLAIVDLAEIKARNLVLKIKRDFPKCNTKAVSFSEPLISKAVFESDILVNASPVGMNKTDPCAVNPAALHKRLAVYDIVYNPPETPLLREAKARRLKSAGGIGMLLYQGAASFELFAGKRAPLSVMRAALKRAIK